MKIIACTITLIILLTGYFIYQEGKFRISNERMGFMLLKNGYRAWWIRYSHGLQYPYRTFRDNLWCMPRYEHVDMRKYLKHLMEGSDGD